MTSGATGPSSDPSAAPELAAARNPSKVPLVDLASIDLTAVVADRAGIELVNPHRFEMALLDAIVWSTPDLKQGIALWRVKKDEFWVRGHFPQRSMLPGVLQVEAAAQLSVWLFNSRFPAPKLIAFTRIHHASFRGQVKPGDDFYLIADEIKAGERRFESNIQGIVEGKIIFDGVIEGIALGPAQ